MAEKKKAIKKDEDCEGCKKEKGVGDMVEGLIKTVAPKLAEKYKDCIGCKNRKVWMNKNLNGIFG